MKAGEPVLDLSNSQFHMDAIDLSDLYRTDPVETTALIKESIDIAQGEFGAIIGPSGRGKCTLLNIIGLLGAPSSGVYFMNDDEVSGHNERNRAEIRKSAVGFVFQSFGLIEGAQDIALRASNTRMPCTDRRPRMEESMERMNIGRLARHCAQQFSGGQQRVAIPCTAVDPLRLILADQYAGNLGNATSEEVMNLLSEVDKPWNHGHHPHIRPMRRRLPRTHHQAA